MSVRMTVRLGVSFALAFAMMMPLTACEGQIPEPASAAQSASPDVSEAKEKKIRAEILDTLNKAYGEKNADELGVRVTGPALDIRSSEITIAKTTGKIRAEATIPTDIAQTVIPTEEGWPRAICTITATTKDQQSKRLLVMTQESARQNYKLAAVARLFPGAELPKFQLASLGSQMGTSKDENLLATPADALSHYADVLQNGANSKYAAEFGNDYFRQVLDQTAKTVQEGMERNNGTQQQTFSVVPDQMWVMRSADGGDLVVGRIDSEWVRQAGDGRESLPASDDEKALFADGKATSTMKVTYVNVVAIYIPPEGASKTMTAVGADRMPVKVEAV